MQYLALVIYDDKVKALTLGSFTLKWSRPRERVCDKLSTGLDRLRTGEGARA
jgi:hypothetical protein